MMPFDNQGIQPFDAVDETDSESGTLHDTPIETPATTPGPPASVSSDNMREQSISRTEADSLELHVRRRRGRPSYYQSLLSDEEMEEPPKPVRKRGRPAKKNKLPELAGFSAPQRERVRDLDTGLDVVDDEYNFDKEDYSGNKKISLSGHLQGGREYRCRTFTLSGRGHRLYVLSTEAARCVGFRDSYMLFSKHRRLYRILLGLEEKWDLVDRGIMPESYKGQTVGVVTARSIFKEFGAKIVVGGRRVQDDYWEDEAIKNGAVPGSLADPDDKLPPYGVPYNRDQYIAWHSVDTLSDQTKLPESMAVKMRRKWMSADSQWLTQHAKVVGELNAELTAERRKKWDTGYYEPHTNLLFFPQTTQPRQVTWECVADDNIQKTPRLDTVIKITPGEGRGVHLLDVPESVLRDVEPEILALINARREQERTKGSVSGEHVFMKNYGWVQVDHCSLR